jgi:hypothetical protein
MDRRCVFGRPERAAVEAHDRHRRLLPVAGGEKAEGVLSAIHASRVLPQVGAATFVGTSLRESAGLPLIPLPSAAEAGQDGSAGID